MSVANVCGLVCDLSTPSGHLLGYYPLLMTFSCMFVEMDSNLISLLSPLRLKAKILIVLI